jgi:MinD-like ATPase involved in chromosome partitioning or flagellar assembly
MTVVSFMSIKGAPGVTTLACLVGATWPEERKVLVAECDQSGGDLAARFQLSSKEGWLSLVAAARRTGNGVNIRDHLQQLPGGLDVLIATRAVDAYEASASMTAFLSRVSSSPDGPWDVLIDVGRLALGDQASAAWLGHSDAVVVCSRSDAASVVQVRDRATLLLDQFAGRVGLALVDGGSHSSSEVERFTGIPVLGTVPFDPQSAAVATGQRQNDRRLRRSMLAASASRMAAVLTQGPLEPRGGDATVPGQTITSPDPTPGDRRRAEVLR